MLESLAERTYRHLFLAQVVALLGTGMATVALGIIFTIKMVAYVGIAPIAGAFADRVNRRALLVGLGYSAVLTPSGRLLRRSAHAQDRPALFAAQFALSHACWLVTYPLFDHPHLKGKRRHAHPFVVDDAHPRWASRL